MKMYEEHANIYDLVNSGIPYDKEAKMLEELLEKCNGNSLLDIACGTGEHLMLIDSKYERIGLDYSEGMIRMAREKNPDLLFIEGDMKTFEFDKKFNVVSCLGSAVQYNLTLEDLEKSINNLVKHAKSYVVFDVRYCIDKWIDGYVKDVTYENEQYKVHEKWISNRIDTFSIWEPVFKVYDKNSKTEYVYQDYHKIKLFSMKEIEEILRRNNLIFEIVDVNLQPCTEIKNTQFFYLILL